MNDTKLINIQFQPKFITDETRLVLYHCVKTVFSDMIVDFSLLCMTHFVKSNDFSWKILLLAFPTRTNSWFDCGLSEQINERWIYSVSAPQCFLWPPLKIIFCYVARYYVR